MFAATFRSLLAHRVRLALTALAIALGTGFMAGSFVFTATLTHSLDSLVGSAAPGPGVVVQHTGPTGAGLGAGGGGTRPVPAAIASVIRGLPGVAAAAGVISARAVLLGRNGKPLPSQFSVALSWPPDPPFQGMFSGRHGRLRAEQGQGMIDRGSARQGHFTFGDRIEIAIAGQARPFTVAGITGYGSADSIAGGSMAVLDLQAAQQLFGLAGRYNQIEVKAAGGVSAQQLRDRVARVLPSGVEVPPAGAAASFGAGLVITVVAAVPPAWRATRVAPVQALRDAVPAPTGFSPGRLAAGLAVTAAGIALVIAGLFAGASAVITVAGALACFLGAPVLGPLLARPLAAAVGLPLTVLPGRTGALARSNAMRNPKRTSATAAALMIGLALIVAVSVLVSSVRSVIAGQITADAKTDFYVQATSADAGITPRLAAVLAAAPGVRQVTEGRTTDPTPA